MAQIHDRPVAVARRRGRPVNSDSIETRNRILRASRQVISERGYHAATFQAIAAVAGLSRPTLHYYFSSREEIYSQLVAQVSAAVADALTFARGHDTLAAQFLALVTALHDTDVLDRSHLAFLVSATLESTRNSGLQAPADNALADFLATLVEDAKARGELAEDTVTAPVVETLHAMLLGIGFYAGFVDDAASIIGKLDTVLTRGVLAGHRADATGRDTVGDTPSAVGGQQ
jgi:AcrR family transcriptional regulator